MHSAQVPVRMYITIHCSNLNKSSNQEIENVLQKDPAVADSKLFKYIEIA